MKRKLFSLLLSICLLSGCGAKAPAAHKADIPCCPLAEQTSITTEEPDDIQGESITLSITLPRFFPEEILDGVGTITLFSTSQTQGVYCTDSGEVALESGVPPCKMIPAPLATELTVEIPFSESVTFFTVSEELYDSGIKASAVFRYLDGRTVEMSYDGLGSAQIELNSHGVIEADRNAYCYEEGMAMDISAEYKGIDTAVTQTLRGKQTSLYCKIQLLHGILTTGFLSDCTRTIARPEGTETVTSCIGDELYQHNWGYQERDYCTIFCPFIFGFQMEDPEGNISRFRTPTEAGVNNMPFYRHYSPGIELGPVYEAFDAPWQDFFRFNFPPSDYPQWAGVTYRTPGGNQGTLCVSGLADGTATLYQNGTTVLQGNLSAFSVFYLPPEEERVLCLSGMGQERIEICYENGTLTAYGAGLSCTVTECTVSDMPFDPDELPAITDWF